MNCSAERAFALAHGPFKIAKIPMRGQPKIVAELALYAEHDFVSKSLSFDERAFEQKELRAVGGLLKPQTVLLDVGANVGWWTFNFATTHAVHSFEPNQGNLALQALSRCLNPDLARRITIYPVGLYHKEPARCALYSLPRNLGNTHTLCGTVEEIEAKVKQNRSLELLDSDEMHILDSLVPPWFFGSDNFRGSTEMRTLDSLVPPWLFHADKIVKLDVEGFEHVALMGGTRLLTTGLPPRALFVEVAFYQGSKRRNLYRFLEQYGYDPVRLVNANMLFLHSAQRAKHAYHGPHGSASKMCSNYCAFHRPPRCNVTCGLQKLQDCCFWWNQS
tara:strand:- start:1532 stop:2527 length:996 start_codon:yes stop_codon:yes gene_type:complete